MIFKCFLGLLCLTIPMRTRLWWIACFGTNFDIKVLCASQWYSMSFQWQCWQRESAKEIQTTPLHFHVVYLKDLHFTSTFRQTGWHCPSSGERQTGQQFQSIGKLLKWCCQGTTTILTSATTSTIFSGHLNQSGFH